MIDDGGGGDGSADCSQRNWDVPFWIATENYPFCFVNLDIIEDNNNNLIIVLTIFSIESTSNDQKTKPEKLKQTIFPLDMIHQLDHHLDQNRIEILAKLWEWNLKKENRDIVNLDWKFCRFFTRFHSYWFECEISKILGFDGKFYEKFPSRKLSN